MAILKVKLKRNLRKSLLQGHPWVYKEAIETPGSVNRAQLCQVIDGKSELAWAIFDPWAPLALRILSFEKRPPNSDFFHKQMAQAFLLRQGIRTGQTTAYRLFNGEGDFLPGLICDIYDSVAVLQTDGTGPREFWDLPMIADWLLKNAGVKTVIEKRRRSSEFSERGIEYLAGDSGFSKEIVVKENGILFKVNLEKGQKTGFFLDQRENRKYVGETNGQKSVLNLFSYTGGFSVYAGVGKARRVASLDVSEGAIQMAQENWELNGLPTSQHEGLCVDVFEYLQDKGEMWDHIIVDPPSMAHSEAQKSAAVSKYTEIFTAAARRVAKQGQLSVSSCTGHIAFSDFFEIIQESLSQARRRGQVLRVSGQGSDHPFPLVCSEMRYLKYVHLSLD